MLIDKALKLFRLILGSLNLYSRSIRSLNKFKIKRLPRKRKITFVVYQSAVWKSDGIYQYLQSLDELDVSITILPIYEKGAFLKEEFDQTTSFFKEKGYAINNIDLELPLLKSIRSFNKIDTVIFSDCWNLAHSSLYYYLLLFKVCCYIPYSHQVSKYGDYQAQYNQLLHNLVMTIYAPHKYEFEIFRNFSDIKDQNVKLLGYPGVTKYIKAYDDPAIAKKLFPDDPWESFSNKGLKRVIWAPHHSINWTKRRYSNFLEMYDFMLKIADIFYDQINFVLKPHPMLKQVLYQHPDWGLEKTDRYFSAWTSKSNCRLEDGPYDSLFYYSDALIHDCGSFIAEYIYLKKPHAFVLSSDDIKNSFNQFGKRCLKNTFQLKGKRSISMFLDKIISNEIYNNEPADLEFIEEINFVSRDTWKGIAKDILAMNNYAK